MQAATLRKPNATLAILALSYLVMIADGSIVVTALPKTTQNYTSQTLRCRGCKVPF